ncbi:MAG TPA: OadG family protein [Acetivibrio sp.]|uniref:OadG family protein n=1 Tax=Acetivibrio sp. TaxID=1872092 RepID=UPI002BAF09E1|nr:OadG family protein [Acetivibrio sp.]HOM02388.1 OadG family protein [Acetivibrio sp.]
MVDSTFVTVLVSVAVIAIIIGLFVYINKKSNSSTSDRSESSVNPVSSSDDTTKPCSNLPDDDALVAVLTAAVLASMGNRPDIKIRVTSFRRIPETSPIWNTVGRKEYISNKL